MFCNLLHNPQVRHLIALGADLDLPTCDEIEAFLRDGLQETELLGAPLRRDHRHRAHVPRRRGLRRRAPARAAELPRARQALHARAWASALLAALDELPRATGRGAAGHASRSPSRCRTTTPSCPSDVGGHQVIRRTPGRGLGRARRAGPALRPSRGGQRPAARAAQRQGRDHASPARGRRRRRCASAGSRSDAFRAYQRRMFDADAATAPTTPTATASAGTSASTRCRRRSSACARTRRPATPTSRSGTPRIDLPRRAQQPRAWSRSSSGARRAR